jgi:hypothetical protein
MPAPEIIRNQAVHVESVSGIDVCTCILILHSIPDPDRHRPNVDYTASLSVHEQEINHVQGFTNYLHNGFWIYKGDEVIRLMSYTNLPREKRTSESISQHHDHTR